uniref:LOW QUALITY PROTEIN: myosin light chain kinase, smooth muscle-like n=1 Tax=Myxine glutinosa TaxID=7769 RepID=UPI0035902882
MGDGHGALKSTQVSKASVWLERTPLYPPAFALSPRNVRVVPGATATFDGKVKGTPEPQVTWYRNGDRLTSGGRLNIEFGPRGTFGLHIAKVTAADVGKYSCEVSNEAGTKQVIVELTLQAGAANEHRMTGNSKLSRFSGTALESCGGIWGESPPKFISKPSRAVIREGGTGRFSCKITGRPTPQVTWSKGGDPLVASEHFHMYERAGLHCLEVIGVQLEDIGSYSCLIASSAGQASAIAELVVKPATSCTTLTVSPSQTSVTNTTDTQEKLLDKRKEMKEERDASPQGPEKLEQTKDEDEINLAPTFTSLPLSKDALEGDLVEFACQVTGKPKPSVQWIKEGEDHKAFKKLMVEKSPGEHALILRQISQDDQGTYNCQVTNSVGTVSVEVKLTVQGLPPKESDQVAKFTSPLSDCCVLEGQTISLQCGITGKPFPDVTWRKDDKVIPEARVCIEEGFSSTTVDEASIQDAGLYSCVIQNGAGKAISRSLVTVKANPRLMAEPRRRGTWKLDNHHEMSTNSLTEVRSSTPRFIQGLSDLQVMDGSQVRMAVLLEGNPPPEVVWLHNGVEIQESEDFHFTQTGPEFTLHIQEVFPEDTGVYTCRAQSKEGESSTQGHLTVQEPAEGEQPWFISKPRAVTARAGDAALLSCAVAGDPFPKVSWLHEGRPIGSGGDYMLQQSGDVFSLVICHSRPCYAGPYEVRIENAIGVSSCAVSLLVIGEEQGELDSWSTQQPEQNCSSPLDAGRSWQHSEPGLPEGKAEQLDFRSVLRHKVHTKECSAETLKQQEAAQKDFRSVLVSSRKSAVSKECQPPEVKSSTELPRNGPAVDCTHNAVDLTPNSSWKVARSDKSTTPPLPPPKHTFSHAFLPKAGNHNISDLSRIESENLCSVPAIMAHAGCESGRLRCCEGVVSQVEEGAPIFTESLRDVRVLDGARLELSCRVQGEPPLSITWTLDGKTLQPSQIITFRQIGDMCSLTIDEVLPEDEGNYGCCAENSYGRDCTTAVVYVDEPPSQQADPIKTEHTQLETPPQTKTMQDVIPKKKPTPKSSSTQGSPPQVVKSPNDLRVQAGNTVFLECCLAGTPPLRGTWFKFRKEIEASGRIQIETTERKSTLSISCSRPDDSGCYTLLLANKFGTVQVPMNVTIVDRPEPPAGKPCVSDVRSTSLTLSWYGPTYDGGSTVQSYLVEQQRLDKSEEQWQPVTSTCHSTSYLLQELEAPARYCFRVRARNEHGLSEPGLESDPVDMAESQDPKQDDDISDDDEKVTEPYYQHVVINTQQKVSELYDIHERLGTGRFGQVFRLVDKKSGKGHAGKFIKSLVAKDKESIRHEIELMNSLHHPKLVQCQAAFEEKSNIIMVMDLISGGELFERIIAEDFELTERECIKYMRQIVEGVRFVHEQGIVHLDLKPENIMCVNKTGTSIKLIDFGLARRLENNKSLKVMFGTPEFVAPEVINYESISYTTDMWSVGVICYILVSGLSPFMGDNDNETLSNVTSISWDFDDEAFDEISDDGKDFITQLLKKNLRVRPDSQQCQAHPWLQKDTDNMAAKKLSKERMKKYMAKKKWQKTGNAVRAIGRLHSMAMLGVGNRKVSLSHKISPDAVDSPAPMDRHPEQQQQQQQQQQQEQEQQHPLTEKRRCEPFFSQTMQDVLSAVGAPAKFECKIEGYPDPEVIWYCNGQAIKESQLYQIDYDEEGNCVLSISATSLCEEGQYMCKALNVLGEASCSARLQVNYCQRAFRRSASRGIQKLNIAELLEESTMASRMSTASSQVKSRASLFEDKGNSKATQQVDFRSVLTKKKSNPPKQGEEQKAPQGVKPQSLEKAPPGSVARVAPHFVRQLANTTLWHGDSLQLHCRLQAGCPVARVAWTMNGRPLHGASSVHISHLGDMCSLTIDNAKASDGGTYTCCAENEKGRAESVARVTFNIKEQAMVDKNIEENLTPVHNATENCIMQPRNVTQDGPYVEKALSKPFFTEVLQDVEVVEGSAARFQCKVKGEPEPDFIWYKNNNVLEEGSRIQLDFEEDGTCCLILVEVAADDDARYTCKAVNAAGEASCSAELLVELMDDEN